jgi:hypothetical protein
LARCIGLEVLHSLNVNAMITLTPSRGRQSSASKDDGREAVKHNGVGASSRSTSAIADVLRRHIIFAKARKARWHRQPMPPPQRVRCHTLHQTRPPQYSALDHPTPDVSWGPDTTGYTGRARHRSLRMMTRMPHRVRPIANEIPMVADLFPCECPSLPLCYLADISKRNTGVCDGRDGVRA